MIELMYYAVQILVVDIVIIIWVSCYTDHLNRVSPTLSKLNEMLKLCEYYAFKDKIIVNASKIQLLYFISYSAKDIIFNGEWECHSMY